GPRRGESGKTAASRAPFKKRTPHREGWGGRSTEHRAGLRPSPRGRRSDGAAGLLASGSSYSRAFPRGQPPDSGDRARAVALPVSYPVTVAGAAPASYRLPSRDARTSCLGVPASPHRLGCQRGSPTAGDAKGRCYAATTAEGGGPAVRAGP